MSTTVIVQFRAKEKNLPQFKELLQSVKQELPQVLGCQSVTVLVNTQDSCEATIVEVWESQSQHEAHLQSLQENGQWQILAELLATPPRAAYQHML